MKRVLRSFAVGLLAGGLVGLWCGMNIGKGQPLLSNPFADVPLSQQASRAGQEVGEVARSAGRELREAANAGAQ